MKSLIAIVVYGLVMLNSVYGQVVCDCRENYRFVYSQLTQSQSFKKSNHRIQEKADSLFDSTYANLMNGPYLPVLDCFTLAVQLIAQISDNHNGLESKGYAIEMKSWEDEEAMRDFEKSEEYRIFPYYPNDLDSIEQKLKGAGLENIEGIYQYGNHSKILFILENEYVNGYILETKLKPWTRGELMFRLIPQTGSRYKMIFGHPVNKKLVSSQEYFDSGFLMQTNIKKEILSTYTFHEVQEPDKSYFLKQVNDSVQHLKIGSFSSSAQGIADARNFSDSIRGHLDSKLLIVDLRGNPGGYRTNAKFIGKVLSQFKGKIVIVVNFRTKSYAEQFAFKWGKKSNVILAGIPTGGMIAYGRNYPTKQKSPDGWFLTHFSDMGGGKFRKYENVGITPDWILSLSEDWIEQVLALMSDQK